MFSSLRLEYSLLKVTIINKLESNLMIQVIRFMQNLDVKFQYETGSFGIAGIYRQATIHFCGDK